MTYIEPTYLYLKRHINTGLLYFGKIRATSQLYKTYGIEGYLGSGDYWSNHLKIHGKNVETLWFCLFVTKEELIEFAMIQSKIMDIVKLKINGKKVFANLIEENGLSGTPKGITYQEERRKICQEKHWARKYKKEENPNYGSTRTEEQKKKMQIAQKNREYSTRLGVKMQKEAKEKLSKMRKGKIALSAEQLNEKRILYETITKIFETRPVLDMQHLVNKAQRNGKILTYERQFQKEYAEKFKLTSNGLFNILTNPDLLLKS